MTPVEAPLPGARYTDLTWRGSADPVRAGLAVVLGLIGYVLAISLVNQLILAASHAIDPRGMSMHDYTVAGSEFRFPEGFLAANLALASLIVVAMVAVRFGLGLPVRYLFSVEGRVRWKLFAAAAVIAAVVFNVFVWGFSRASVAHFGPQPDAVWFLLIMVITSPFQAAAEEFFFRGLLLGSVGALTRNPWVGIVFSALVFALFHGAAQSAPLFVDRFAFGLVAGWLALATGGLEVGIAAHILNNVCAFTYAALFSTIASIRTQTQVSWWSAAADVTTFAVIAVLSWLVARRLSVRTMTPEAAASRRFARRDAVR